MKRGCESVNRERDKGDRETDLRRKEEKVTGYQFISLFVFLRARLY